MSERECPLLSEPSLFPHRGVGTMLPLPLKRLAKPGVQWEGTFSAMQVLTWEPQGPMQTAEERGKLKVTFCFLRPWETLWLHEQTHNFLDAYMRRPP